jgi:hypothetical protein
MVTENYIMRSCTSTIVLNSNTLQSLNQEGYNCWNMKNT